MKLTAILWTTAAAVALAQPPGGMGGGVAGGQPPVDDVKAYLTLTDSQITSFGAIRTNAMNAARTIQQDLQTKTKALQETLDKGTTDAAAVGRQMLDIAALRKRMEQIHADAQVQAAAVLSATQKTKLQTLVDASKLREEVQQASMLGLIARDGAGPGFGGGRPQGPGAGGPGGGRPGRPAGQN